MPSRGAAQLAQLRALRASGKTRLDSYEVAEEQKVYEEVDEEAYKKVVRGRLDQDDFVVDDNGEGYADDGREEWMDEKGGYASSSEDEGPAKGRPAKRKRDEDREKIERTNNSINKYFSNNPIAAVPKPKTKPVDTVEDKAFLAGLLDEVDMNVVASRKPGAKAKTIKSENRRKVRVLSPPTDKPKPSRKAHAPTPPEDNIGDDLPPLMDDDMPMSDPVPSSPTANAVERKEQTKIKIEEPSDEEDDDFEVSQAVGAANATSVNMSGSRPAPKVLKKPSASSSYPTPESSSPTRAPAADGLDPTAWSSVTERLNVLSSSPNIAQPGSTPGFGKASIEDVIEEDGTIRFFWTDYLDVNGGLCLFGKVKDKKKATWISSFVKVSGIMRKLYFLPRKALENGEEVGMEDVYHEVDKKMSKFGIREHKIKETERKYAFEMKDIPREAKYLKLMYPYEKPAPPADLKGDTFSHVFGMNTALFEQFVLWKNIMGPCWLKLDAESFQPLANASWCKLELEVKNPKAVSPITDAEAQEAPPLTMMSLAFRHLHNAKENKQEIVAVSARIYENISLSDTTPTDKLPCKSFTIMRPANGSSYPVGFEALCKKQPGSGSVMLEKSEQMLLSKFMAMLERVDPDVLMGHQLQEVDYPVLLARLRERKTPGWHRVGRLRRKGWPVHGKSPGSNFFTERQLVAGRLLCDIANDMGRSLMTKCQSWTLTEMCSLYLKEGQNFRQDLDAQQVLNTWGAQAAGLLSWMQHCEADTYFIAAIAMRVQVLPLSKVLTNLAGNSWARTLSGTRAERNEYILLHEFHRNKYICPDKVWGKGKVKQEDTAAEGGEGAVDVKKKDKYKGGLVFEPEKGLYDKCVLVMDFNSLYPSIIQEYNICFTTVERFDLGDANEEGEQVPEVPADGTKAGILPKLIATLVNRRREVKKLMKDRNATAEQLATWDIKQLALKLTANSMYGCLGYTQSRFYARPLAMLTTYKGREILRSTKDLAESRQLRVVYGDTDSVMINTNVDSVDEALRIGNEFKKAVNDSYRLLEIDIDNIFKRLLLHAKKKYAAMNLIEVQGADGKRSYIEKLEVKGLDMRRREYCALSKDASQRLLNEIFSGLDPEEAITKIKEYLRELSAEMRESKINTKKYVIYTKLGKDPRAYDNAEGMPQVQVALRSLAAGKTVRVNDVIAYITTAQTEENNESSSAKRAYDQETVIKSCSANGDGKLKPDVDWYLAKQIFPPIERLCAPIDGIDGGQLAECLGLDPKRYSSVSGSGNSNNNGLEITPLDSQLPDSVRFQDCPRLKLRCNRCKHAFEFLGLKAAAATSDGDSDDDAMLTAAGLRCPKASGGCGAPLRTLALVAQTEHAMRQLALRYYDGRVACNDPVCGAATRSVGVYGHRCPGPQGLGRGCGGRVRYELSGKVVGNTLAYWRGLWDVDHVEKGAAANVKTEDAERVRALREWNRERFETVRKVVEAYERRCGWMVVQMDSLFSFALR